MSGYLDASVLLAILLNEAASERVDQFINAGESLFSVSEFAAAKVASGPSLRVRTVALTASDAQDRRRGPPGPLGLRCEFPIGRT